MNFNKHFELRDKHAILSPSQHYFIRYDNEKLKSYITSKMAVERGTKLHKTAELLIQQKIYLPENGENFNNYVNDCIRDGMKPEQILYYSKVCFGTADAIKFEDNTLYIYDLKTGKNAAHMEQLLIYAALFCLEYNVRPSDISIVCRLYQYGEIKEDIPSVDTMEHIIDKIKTSSEIVLNMLEGEDNVLL